MPLGVHPHDAATWSGEHDRRRLEELVSHPRVVAVGECGLEEALRARAAQRVVAVGPTKDVVRVVLADPDSGLSCYADIATPHAADVIAVGDINGNGLDDVAFSDGSTTTVLAL